MERIHCAGFGLLAGLAAVALACGGAEEAPRPSGNAMTASAAARPPAGEQATNNAAPVIHSVRFNPKQPAPGVPITAVVDASDPDGDPLRFSYEWRVNGDVISSGGKASLSLSHLDKGDAVEVVVVASDGWNESEPHRVRARAQNRAPIVDLVLFSPEGEIRAGDVVTASPEARDPDGDELRFEYAWLVNGTERGDGREFDTRQLRRGDSLRVRVVASDGESQSRAFESPEVVLSNTPPRITRLPELQTDGGTFRYEFEAVDADGDRNLRFFLDQAPAGMTIDPIVGLLTWSPTASQVGVHPVEVGVRDSYGEGTTFLFELTVGSDAESTPANAAD